MTGVPLALVHHANQLVVTDGYADRDGLSATAAGYDAVLTLHIELGVPAALHLSGSVLQAIAWHRPALLRRLRGHLASGLVTLLGGTYGENILPLSSPHHNRRQLRAFHDLVEDLLGVPREALKTAWVPERVWHTPSCVPPLRDAAATGVCYQRVLLDDRLRHPLHDGQYQGSPRAEFDASGPYQWHVDGFPATGEGLLHADGLTQYRIAGGDGMTALPIASHLRYLVPPHDPAHLQLLADAARHAQEGCLLVFADDLERVAGVAGWERGLERYARFLRWLARSDVLEAVALDAWCDHVEPDSEIAVDPGTYYELAHSHGAGEDYSKWANDSRWRPYAEQLDRVEVALEQAEEDRADPGLCSLAEHVLLLGRHETAWQDLQPNGGRSPAPWTRATAAHAADALCLLAAARWVSEPAPSGLRVLLSDLDEDGEDELVVSGDRLFAVISPRYGGRLTLLVHRQVEPDGTRRGLVIVGNPADHWNFQTELHRHMQTPPNHPGALAVLGTESHRHEIGRVEVTSQRAAVELIDVEPGDDRGLSKQLVLEAHGEALVVCVRRSGLPGELRTSVALSPDYAELLRAGRERLQPTGGTTWWGASAPAVEAWVAHDPAEDSGLLVATSPTTGHTFVGAIDGCGRHLHLVLGVGPVDDGTGRALIAAADATLHSSSRRVAAAPVLTGS